MQVTNGSDPVPIHNITLDNVTVKHFSGAGSCTYAQVNTHNIHPVLPRGPGCGGPPPPNCTISTTGQACYDDSQNEGLGLAFQQAVHDHTTLELCADACFENHMPVAGIDRGNHCFCGAAGSLDKAKALLRPLPECQTSPCYANKEEKCGGKGRMLTFSFTCT